MGVECRIMVIILHSSYQFYPWLLLRGVRRSGARYFKPADNLKPSDCQCRWRGSELFDELMNGGLQTAEGKSTTMVMY